MITSSNSAVTNDMIAFTVIIVTRPVSLKVAENK